MVHESFMPVAKVRPAGSSMLVNAEEPETIGVPAGSTVTPSDWLVDAVAPRVLVAVIVRLADVAPLCSVNPGSCPGVSVQVPSLLFCPAERLASAGTPAMVGGIVARGSSGVSLILSATVPPALTDSD